LLGREYDREGATLLRGDPDEVAALIDSSQYAKKYTSGVLSFAEADLPPAQKQALMTSFEKALLPGMEARQYSCLWVEHRDKGRLELNFVIPNVELTSGKRLQPYYHAADKRRVEAWATIQRAELKLADPHDPARRRALVTPRDLPPDRQKAAEQITNGLLAIAEKGELRSRADVVECLTSAGFTVARETKSSISIADPDGGKNLRLKGALYERDFRLSPELRKEISAASWSYRTDVGKRLQEARADLAGAIEIKRAELARRHPGPRELAGGTVEADRGKDKGFGFERLEMGSGERGGGDSGRRRPAVVDGPENHQQREAAGPAISPDGEGPRLGGGVPQRRQRRVHHSAPRSEARDGLDVREREAAGHQNREVDHDGNREAIAGRFREFADATRRAAAELSERIGTARQALSERLGRLTEAFIDRGTRTGGIGHASQELEQSGVELGQAAATFQRVAVPAIEAQIAAREPRHELKNDGPSMGW
jgi:hypothetical protein